MEQTNNNALATLSNNEYIIAAIQPKYNKLDTQKRQALLTTFIAEVYKFRGQIANSADLVDMARDIDRKLTGDANLSLLTLEEIRVAFLHGVAGDYGEYYGINYVTLSNWVNSYYFSEERIEIIKRYKQARARTPQITNLLAQKTMQTTEKEAEELQIQNIIRYYNDVHRDGAICAMVHSQAEAYRYLVNRGFMNPTKDEKRMAIARAEQWLKSYKDKGSRSTMEIFDECYDSSQKVEVTDRDKVIRKAKSIILADWLKSLDSLPQIEPLIK